VGKLKPNRSSRPHILVKTETKLRASSAIEGRRRFVALAQKHMPWSERRLGCDLGYSRRSDGEAFEDVAFTLDKGRFPIR